MRVHATIVTHDCRRDGRAPTPFDPNHL